MIADIFSNKKLNSVVSKHLLQVENETFHLFFIVQSCFKVPKDVRINSTHYFVMKTPNKREF